LFISLAIKKEEIAANKVVVKTLKTEIQKEKINRIENKL
jgi:hypothetical protein